MTATTAMLRDAFEHHNWASLVVLDACADLSDEQLSATVPGIYGSILDTLRHLVEADVWYLHTLTDPRVPTIDESTMGVPELRAEMARNGPRWRALLDRELDPEQDVAFGNSQGETHAPMGIRIAQVLHHGTDHRSQVCTVLTSLGITPPSIDLWDFAQLDGRLVDVGFAEAPAS